MSNELTVGIIGLYTVVYVIVFFVQKSLIERTKEINASMESFIDIFKIDEVKKYVEMKDERIMMQVDKIVSDDECVRKIMKESMNESLEKLEGVYFKQMGNQHLEMLDVIVDFIKMIKVYDRERFINEKLSSLKHVLIPILEELDKDDDIGSNEP